jgi:hypothetical protein
MGGFAPGQVSTGTQQTLVITCSNTEVAPTGVVYLDGRREKFSSKYNDTIVESEPCDNGGVIDLVRIPGKITGSLTIARQNAAFGAVIAALDAAFYSGAPDTAFTITSTEPAVDGTGVINSFQYQNVRFHEYEPGEWSRNAKTMVSTQFTCSLRNQLQ